MTTNLGNKRKRKDEKLLSDEEISVKSEECENLLKVKQKKTLTAYLSQVSVKGKIILKEQILYLKEDGSVKIEMKKDVVKSNYLGYEFEGLNKPEREQQQERKTTLRKQKVALKGKDNIEEGKNVTKEEKVNTGDSDLEFDGMSEYERRREENLRDNAKFMASLGINQAKEMLNATVPKRNNQRISTKRVYTATRRSARIGCIQPQPKPEIVVEPEVRKPLGTVKMSDLLEYENGEQNIQRHSAFASELKRIAVKSTSLKIKAPLSTSLQSFLKDFSKVKVTENQVRKIVGARIFSVVMHPTKDKVLVGGGGQNGSIGLWDVKQGLAESGAVLYFPHSQPVNCLLFNPYNLDQLFSCSYDGTLRCGYFEKGVSEGIYYTPVDDDVLLRNFVFQNANIMLVSQNDGNVAVIDVRTKSAKPEHLFHASKKALRTVDIHPTKEDYVITAGADCMVSLWDLRTIKKKPKKICSLSAGRIINSAYFSPITGKYILSTSQDNTLRIHDSSELSSKISCLQSISHNTYTGRWVTKFRATWHPLREDLFACGGNAQPRRIELFSDEGHRVMALQHVALINSIQALNIFHPTINAVVGANASGKLHVFM